MMHTYLKGAGKRGKGTFLQRLHNLFFFFLFPPSGDSLYMKLFSNSLFRHIIRLLLEGKTIQTHSTDRLTCSFYPI